MANRRLIEIVIACWLLGFTGSTASATDESENARLAITDWIHCIECADGELDRLIKFGQVVVPHLSTMLAGGPAQSTRERVQQLNTIIYERLKAYAKKYSHSRLSVDKEVFLKRNLDNFVYRYRSRAAYALTAIGGEKAQRVLLDALETTTDPRLKTQLQKLLEQ